MSIGKIDAQNVNAAPVALPSIAAADLVEAVFPVLKTLNGNEQGKVTTEVIAAALSEYLILAGEDAPAASLLMAGRRAFYFRTDSNGDVTELHVSLDGLDWKEVGTGGDALIQGAGIRITDNGDGTRTIAVTRPLTRAQQTRINES